jgi:SAM-dependent methyltransferase
VLGGADRFDKIFAMNVNLFWVRSPARELDLLKRLLGPGGALYLFYGYGERPQPGKDVMNAVPGALTGHLTESGFTVDVRQGPGVVCVAASP